MPKVGVFGSCRVHAPLKLTASRGAVEYVNDRCIGYLHSTADIVQAVKILRGDITPAPFFYDLLSVINRKYPVGEDIFQRAYSHVDAFIVEVSSVRIIQLQQYSLQINRFKEVVRSIALGDDKRPVIMGSPLWDEILRDARVSSKSEQERSLVHDFELYEQSQDQILEGISSIIGLLEKPIMFVGHVNSDRSGQPIRQRQWIVDAFSEARKRMVSSAWSFFDPTQIVLGYGYERAMTDSAHFSKEFENVVSFELERSINEFLKVSASHG